MTVAELIKKLQEIPDQTLKVAYDIEWALASVDEVNVEADPYVERPGLLVVLS